MRVRTGYSFRNAVGKIDDVLDRLVDLGFRFAPITDTESTFGYVNWTKACNDRGLKPIYGIELAVSPDPQAKKPRFDYWTFFAKDSIAPINELLRTATNPKQFRYRPLLTYDQAMKADCFKVVGSRTRLCDIDPIEDLWVELSPACSKGYLEWAEMLGFPVIAMDDNRYPLPFDRGLYETICGRNASSQSYPQHILTPEAWMESVAWKASENQVTQAFVSRKTIWEGSQATLQVAELYKPERAESLREMCERGATDLSVDLSDPIYAERLDRELRLIAEKQYEDYFYIIADICQAARKICLVGPARGSSCGSLVCYLLRITSIDPIPYGLIFERFIDINRMDLPDIDIDFSDRRRELVFDYVRNKYGSENVSRLGSVALYKPRSALNEAGAALGVPKWEIEPVIDSLLERSSGDSRALQSIEDTLAQTEAGRKMMAEYPHMKIAARMEGHPRHSGQHAAGIVVIDKPVIDYVAIDTRKGAANCDKHDAETLNLLKIDALGLTQLSTFEMALELAGLSRNHLDSIPLDDPEAFDVLNKRHFAGVFQFNGIALQQLTEQLVVDKLDDIISITALARPGPLASGGATEWVKRRNGVSRINYPHDCFRPFLEDTYGIVLYQEQVMNIGREIGDLTWGDVTALRKAMSKSLGKEYFDQFGDRWKIGALAKGVDKEDADKVWDDLCAYGAWSFNKSHSVAYGLISYWCCWLKAHYPVEFAAATLSNEADERKQLQTLRELAEEGIDYEPVRLNESGEHWQVALNEVGKKIVIGPLSNITGVGPKTIKAVLGARARGELLPEWAAKKVHKGTVKLDSLWPISDAFRRVLPSPGARNITTPPTPLNQLKGLPNEQIVVCFVIFTKINPRDENEAVKVAKRGYEITKGPTTSLNLYMEDDTGIVFGKIQRQLYAKIGDPIVQRGRPEKLLYAVKGKLVNTDTFLMLNIDMVKYIGEFK